MKKSLLVLTIFSTLPFSATHCITREQATFGVGCATIAGAAGTYYYFYHYKPSLNNTNNANNSTKVTPAQVTTNKTLTDLVQKPTKNSDKTLTQLVQERFPQTSAPEVKTEIDTPKILPVTQKTEEKPTSPAIVTENTKANVESVTKAESCFLNNVRNSIEKMNLERLLLENMDVLEG